MAHTRRAVISAAVFLTLAAGMFLLAYLRSFLLLVFAGLLFSVLLTGLSQWLSARTRLPYAWALTIITVLLFGSLYLFARLSLPTLTAQTEALRASLPHALDRLEDEMRSFKVGRKMVDELRTNPPDLMANGSDILSHVSHLFSSTLGALARLLIVLITGIFLAVNPRMYTHGFSLLFQPGYRPRVLQVLEICYHHLRLWLFAKALSMAAIGLFVGTGLHLLGVPMATVLALMAALFSFVPKIGFLLSLVPALLIALLQSAETALWVAGLYVAADAVESYLLTPLLYQQTVALPPALLLVVQVLMGIIGGGLGLLLAAPLLATALVLLKELYVKDYLEQRPHRQPAAEPG